MINKINIITSVINEKIQVRILHLVAFSHYDTTYVANLQYSFGSCLLKDKTRAVGGEVAFPQHLNRTFHD